MVRLGAREVARLEVRVPGETLHLVFAAGLGVGLLDAAGRARLREAMRGAPVSPAQARWRARFEGGEVRPGARAVDLHHGERSARVECGRGEDLVWTEGAPASPLEPVTREALEARAPTILESLARAGVAGRRDRLRRALAKAVARVGRRVAAVKADLERTNAADAMALRAHLFVAAAGAAPRGAARLEAVDWSTGEPVAAELPIDPARGAREQIDGMFRRARRLKEGARIAERRLADAQGALAGLESALAGLGAPEPDFDALEARARDAAPRDFKLSEGSAAQPAGGGRARRGATRLPYRTFAGGSGSLVLVGRGAADNDALSLHVARPHDLWLHAKDRNGAHVIVPLDRGASCPPDLLVEAAHLAAHFSDARDERVVDIQYTPRRYLRKPRGSGPGFVVVEREKVLVLRREDAILRRLLEAERLPDA